ncbi:GNAT family N-acetyltransferase [Hephaestia mangrovi]|uniref:GNAT family N-acetyltransferase n=1 Tax=Hephaestia mangrovi TaxID=2873268 RepID=UPI0021053D8E|nr:GNAT family N-acetyltransferase [Hephaestia mangrovi]
MADRQLPHVRIAAHADRPAVAAMLARAFADDPAMRFIFPDPADRAKRLPRLFSLLFDGDAPVGMRLVTTGTEAATLWRAPGKAETGIWEMIRHAPRLLHALGGATGRALRVANAIDAHHPKTAFWYLHIAGCDPAFQGRGIGGAIIRHGLARTAGDNLPCYLETPLEKNVGFYRGLGFELVDTWDVPRGGPRFWSMARQPGP